MAFTNTACIDIRNSSTMLKVRHPVVFGLAIALLGAMPAQAQEDITLRDRLHIVSSSSNDDATEILVEAFMNRYADVRPPRVEAIGSSTALERFCAGVGANTPDIAIVGRRISRPQLNDCQTNGVRDVVELQLGKSAVVIVSHRADGVTNLSTQQVYTALAAELAREDDFIPNTLNVWSDVGASTPPAPTRGTSDVAADVRGSGGSLPVTPIRAILPDRSSSTRLLFNDFVLEGGCRDVKAVRRVFLASIRVPLCTNLRRDGRVTEVSLAEVPAALLDSPMGTIAAVTYAQVVESGGNLAPIALNGVMPSATAIANGEYELSRTIYLYAKRQHARSVQGVGVVRGVREFAVDAVSEATAGPGGALSSAGVVPLTAARRAAQRSIADRLTLISR